MQQQIREYQITEKIGEGGMGVVYKGYDTNLERTVAVKAIHSTFTSNNELVARFRQEAKVQAGLLHPNIVSLYNFFQEEDCYYMVMEYVDGETLSQRIKSVGLIPPHKCIPMFLQMLEGLDYAHRKGVVHRDIKPSNILIDKDDNIKLMDFGIAKIVTDKGMTKTGTKIGTVNYMSPEQITGAKDIDNRSDIYSLGITFFEMLTGQLPYNTETESEFNVMQQIVSNQIPSVKKYYPYVPEKVDQAIEKSTQKNREIRFQTCREFYEFIKFEEIGELPTAEKKKITSISGPNKLEGSIEYNIIECSGCGTRNRVPSNKDINAAKCGKCGSPLVTPSRENVPTDNKYSFEGFPKPSPGKRIGALLLDSLVLGVLWVIVIAMANASTRDGRVGILFLLGLPLLIFSLFKDGIRQGKGIGKGMVGLRVINARNGVLISMGAGFGRVLLTSLSYIIYVWIIDIILVLVHSKGQRLVDFLLGTQVVEEDDIIIEGESVYPKNPVYRNVSPGMEICPFCHEPSMENTVYCNKCGKRKK